MQCHKFPDRVCTGCTRNIIYPNQGPDLRGGFVEKSMAQLSSEDQLKLGEVWVEKIWIGENNFSIERQVCKDLFNHQ